MGQSEDSKGFVAIGLSTILGISLTATATASHGTFFSASPQMVERDFGRHWTRLTAVAQSAFKQQVTYTYNPNRIRSLFQKTDQVQLSVTFMNNRANRIRIYNQGAGFRIASAQIQYPDGYALIFDDLFERIFGIRPNPKSPIYRRFIKDDSGDGGTFHTSTYCISPGIAVTYDWVSERNLVTAIEFYPEPGCRSDSRTSAAPILIEFEQS